MSMETCRGEFGYNLEYEKELVGVKGLEENWKVSLVSHALLFI